MRFVVDHGPVNSENETENSAISTDAASATEANTSNNDTQNSTHNKDTHVPAHTSLPSVDTAAKTMASCTAKSNLKSEENLLDLIGRDDNESECSELEYDAELDLPNPGEIVEEPDGLVRDFVTKLSFTSRVACDGARHAEDSSASSLHVSSGGGG